MNHPYLGVMLDVSRHFMPVEDVLRLIDAVSLCGVNTLHWHLTDDQGWHIEIKKYPQTFNTQLIFKFLTRFRENLMCLSAVMHYFVRYYLLTEVTS